MLARKAQLTPCTRIYGRDALQFAALYRNEVSYPVCLGVVVWTVVLNNLK